MPKITDVTREYDSIYLFGLKIDIPCIILMHKLEIIAFAIEIVKYWIRSLPEAGRDLDCWIQRYGVTLIFVFLLRLAANDEQDVTWKGSSKRNNFIKISLCQLTGACPIIATWSLLIRAITIPWVYPLVARAAKETVSGPFSRAVPTGLRTHSPRWPKAPKCSSWLACWNEVSGASF